LFEFFRRFLPVARESPPVLPGGPANALAQGVLLGDGKYRTFKFRSAGGFSSRLISRHRSFIACLRYLGGMAPVRQSARGKSTCKICRTISSAIGQI
jgi:hypothetical protein